jgi:hypothetical protein
MSREETVERSRRHYRTSNGVSGEREGAEERETHVVAVTARSVAVLSVECLGTVVGGGEVAREKDFATRRLVLSEADDLVDWRERRVSRKSKRENAW